MLVCMLAALLVLALVPPAAAQGCGPGRGAFCDSTRALFPDRPAWRRGGDQDRARDASRAGQVLPLDAIMRNVRASHSGRLLDANLVRAGTGYIYLIKIIDEANRVRILQVDAQSGGVLGTR